MFKMMHAGGPKLIELTNKPLLDEALRVNKITKVEEKQLKVTEKHHKEKEEDECVVIIKPEPKKVIVLDTEEPIDVKSAATTSFVCPNSHQTKEKENLEEEVVIDEVQTKIKRGSFVSEVIVPDSGQQNPPTSRKKRPRTPEEIQERKKRRMEMIDPLSDMVKDCPAWHKFNSLKIMSHTLVIEAFPPHVDINRSKQSLLMSSGRQRNDLQLKISHYFQSSQDLPKSDADLRNANNK